ncbi:hypothetical protein ACHAXA_005966 [Cyclostephanos tholiformis]|uniref:Uncharacterized protein n=1 Tax=Cyclostephanos tholiformis TaxID=382380 RepID=A0ABD3SE26_9STRA
MLQIGIVNNGENSNGNSNNNDDTAIVIGNAAGGDGNNIIATTIDPYLADDFYPLFSASREILNALRADESAPDADLFRRLISSSSSIPHRYHVAGGDEGRGVVSSSAPHPSPMGGGGIGGGGRGGRGGGRASPQALDVVGSPLAAVRGRMNARPSSSVPNDVPPVDGGHPPSSSSSTTIPPTSHLRYERSIPLPDHLSAVSSKAKFSSLMGLLPDADLVWMSADDKFA